MNAKELADAVVALKVAEYDAALASRLAYSVRNKHGHWDHFEDELLVRDWSVAGALMEKCEAQCIEWNTLEPGHWRNMNHTSNTPRAIVEACVEALTKS